MPSPTFGAASPLHFSVPADCVLQSQALKKSNEIHSYKNAQGVTIKTVASKMQTVEETVEMVGLAPLTTVVAAEVSTAGIYKPVSLKLSESNAEFPKSTVTIKGYENN